MCLARDIFGSTAVLWASINLPKACLPLSLHFVSVSGVHCVRVWHPLSGVTGSACSFWVACYHMPETAVKRSIFATPIFLSQTFLTHQFFSKIP